MITLIFLVYFQHDFDDGMKTIFHLGLGDKLPSGVPIHEIQQHILKTSGPVVTHRSFITSAPKNQMRKVTFEEFVHAISTMEDYGQMHQIMMAGSLRKTVFIKKTPEELTTWDLCPAWRYTQRYHRPSPSAIGGSLRAQLVNQNLVSEELLK